MREISDIIPLLIILNPAQGSGSIKGRFWENTGKQKADLIKGQSWSLILETDPQTDQEVMSQGDQQHMVMPTQPTAHLVVIKPDFTFSFFKDGFDWPSHSADADKLDHGCSGGSIAEVVFDDRRVFQITAQDQPNFRTRQVCPRLGHPQESKVADDGAFATFFDRGAGPAIFRDSGCESVHLGWALARMAQAQAGWVAAMPTPLGNIHFGSDTPDRGDAFDLGEIPLSQGSDSVPKSRRISIQFIRSHPGEGQTATFHRFFQQFQTNFWLGLVNQAFRQTTRAALFGMRFVKPLIRHEQLPLDQAVPFAARISQINPHLTIRNFAHRPTVLRSHSHRVIPLLDHTRFVNQHHPVRFTQCLTYQPLMNSDHWLLFPRTLADEMLHATDILAQLKRHALNVLARRIPQQPLQIALAPFQLLLPQISWFKHFYVGSHFIHKTVKILVRQITLRCRTSRGYNSAWHGIASFPLGRGWRKDTMPSYFKLLSPSVANIAL